MENENIIQNYKLLKPTLWTWREFHWQLESGETCKYFAHSDTYLFESRDNVVPFFGRNVIEARPEWFQPLTDEK